MRREALTGADILQDALNKKGETAKVEIILPIRIESEANRREHWAVKASRTKIHRASACLMVSPLRRKILSIGPKLTIRLTRIAPRELDDDNLARGFKAVRDGVADALGMDDRDRRLRWAYAQERGEPGEYAVRIDIEGVAE
jgi:hypothetical protein